MNVGLILWAGNDAGHDDHLHVEGVPKHTGTPPKSMSQMTPGLRVIYDGLVERFGTTSYFLTPNPLAEWHHMGMYNRRPIAGSTTWSQHAYYNAIDIGPYVGVKAQQKFYDFLTGKDEHMDYEIIAGQKWYDVDDWPSWASASIRKNIIAGIIRGKDVWKDGKVIGKRFDPNIELTRAEAAVLLDRIDAV